MKKLNIEQLKTTTGGVRLRTCFIAGVLTSWGGVMGGIAGGYGGAATALIAGLSSANYNGCFN